MSRIGRLPIPVPGGVSVEIHDHTVSVAGPRGSLSLRLARPVSVSLAEGAVHVARSADDPASRALHGLTRSLIANMIEGVTRGFGKSLEIVGVGYRAQMQGKTLNLALGFSHPVAFTPPPGIEIAVEGTNKIHIRGADKQAVGQVAAQVRALRPPEPYKGKGIRYEGERVRRKLGKAGKTAAKK
jgi:large subunit ribosomal protein L6